MIPRIEYLKRVETALRRSPVVALLGPRQCGKTTLARIVARRRKSVIFDLESIQDERRLQNPELTLGALKGLIVVDEIQRRPDLFPILRVLVDRPRFPARFLILGSAMPQLVRAVSESLAGRVEFVEMGGFGLWETGVDKCERLWVQGGFPRSFLAKSPENSVTWREGFIRTFLERDLPQLGIRVPAPAMRRFWTMLAHYHGQVWNASEVGGSLGLSDKTVRGYLDVLTETFMVRQLQPWHENLSKRQVKSPKIFFRDSGLLHSLLALYNNDALASHPRVGASWEGFALEQILRMLRVPEAYFWGAYSGAELDLLVMCNGRRYGFEFKYAEAPQASRSVYIALADLKLDHLWIVHAGRHSFPIAERVSACALPAVPSEWRTVLAREVVSHRVK